MKKIHFPYNQRIKDFLPSYLLMILIPIVIGVYIFLRMEGVINKQVLDTNAAFIKQFSAVVDQNIREIEQLATFITTNKTVERIGSMYSLNPRNIMNVTELKEQMIAYSISNENITDYFIYFPGSNFIYSPHATYSIELFYKHRYFLDEGFEVFNQTLNNYYTGNFLPMFLHDYINNKNYLVYAKTFSKYKPGSIIANAFIIFDLSKLPAVFNSHSEVDRIGNYMIMTRGGRLIYGQHDFTYDDEMISQIINSNSSYIEYEGLLISKNESSEEESWFYTVSTSTSELLKPIFEIRRDALTLFIVSIIGSILLAYVLSINSYQPINDLLSEVKPILDQFIVPANGSKNNIKDDFKQIEITLKKMADDNQTAAERIKSMMPVVRNNLLLSILNGNMKIEKSNDVNKIFQSHGIYFQYEYFTVIIIEKFEDNMHENIKGKSGFMFYATVSELARKIIDSYGVCLCVEIPVGTPCIILNTPAKFTESDILEFAKKLIKDISSSQKLRTQAYIGSCYKGYSGMRQSFEEARISYNYRNVIVFDDIIYYQNIKQTNMPIIYSSDIQTRFENSIRAGNLNEALKILDNIYQTNFSDRTIAPEVASCLLSSIYVSLMRCAESIDAEVYKYSYEKSNLLLNGNIHECYLWLKDLCEIICNKVNMEKESKKAELKKKIELIIEENITYSNLDQTFIAGKIGVTPSYFSCLFKELFNTGMSEYISKRRCSLAAVYLKDSEMTVDAIAKKVGLLNGITLNRIFKKYYGITPGQYRDLNNK